MILTCGILTCGMIQCGNLEDPKGSYIGINLESCTEPMTGALIDSDSIYYQGKSFNIFWPNSIANKVLFDRESRKTRQLYTPAKQEKVPFILTLRNSSVNYEQHWCVN